MKKVYFYAPSYVVLRQYFYIKQKFPEIILVSAHRDLVKVANAMHWEVIDCCEGPEDVKDRGINKVAKLFRYWEKNNERIDAVLSRMDHGVFYFSTLLIDLWGLKLVQKLSLKNKNVDIIYLDDVKVTANYQKMKKLTFAYRYIQWYSMIRYLLPLKWFDTGGGYYLGVTEDFLKKYGIRHDKSPDPFYSPVGIPEVPLKVPIEVLIVGGERLDENKNLINPESIKAVLRFIKKIRPDAYFKYHPGKPVHNELCDSFNQAESFIPVEFFHKSVKIAVSDFSIALINLSLLGVKCVSYLNLLETYSSFDKNFWVKKLTEDSNGKICFVNSFDELAVLLKENNHG